MSAPNWTLDWSEIGAVVKVDGAEEQDWWPESSELVTSAVPKLLAQHPLVIVKMMIVPSLLHDLAIASLDVGDAFLQGPQVTTVLIKIPRWALQVGGNSDSQVTEASVDPTGNAQELVCCVPHCNQRESGRPQYESVVTGARGISHAPHWPCL